MAAGERSTVGSCHTGTASFGRQKSVASWRKTRQHLMNLYLGLSFVIISVKGWTVARVPSALSRSSSFSMADENEVDLISADDDDDSPASDESFTSEAVIAQQANEFAARNGSVELKAEVSDAFLQYALSIILGRAIPDARDGLKPVHRRILYAMDQLRLQPSSPHRKCARIVGEVLGKFHPHGDMAVYDALVRLAQDFSTNHPLIDGHGNFGSIDADPAAAMRYTEARLTPLSRSVLLEDLQEDAVEFVPNFDGNEIEPTVLPARLPLLLLNGASGIAVGMATNIPPHNLKEILSACSALVKSRQTGGQAVSDDQLLKLVPAPDFPTGALIMGTSGSKKLYETSNGGVIMRSLTHIEQISFPKKAVRNAIIVTELPYQVNKAALLEKIASLVNDKKIDGISDLRDESDRDGIRVVIELKRDAIPDVVLNQLFVKTPLQTTFSGNFLSLMSKSGSLVPHRFMLREALDCFLDFRFETIRRISENKLRKVKARSEIVDGLLVALQNADDVIEIVREAADQGEARTVLSKTLQTNPAQNEAILKLQLGQLTKLNKGKLEAEKQDLEESKKELTTLLDVDDQVYEAMLDEFSDLSNKFGVDRKSKIMPEEDAEIDDIDLVTNSRSIIVVTRGGYIKRMPLKTFESQKRGTRGKRGTSEIGGSTESEVSHFFSCNDHDTLLMVTQAGIAYGLRAFQVPIAARTAKGQPIPTVLPLKADDVITTVLPVSDFAEDEFIILVTENGWIKKTALSAFQNLSSRGLTIASIATGDRLRWCQHCKDGDDILVGTSMGKATRFDSDKLRATGRTSRGVTAIKLQEGDTIADVEVLSGAGKLEEKDDEFVLAITSQGFGKRVSTKEFRTQARGGSGVIALKFKKGGGNDKVERLVKVKDADEVLLITEKGIVVRQNVTQIPSQSRSATGVTVQRLDQGDRISRVSIVPEYEDSS